MERCLRGGRQGRGREELSEIWREGGVGEQCEMMEKGSERRGRDGETFGSREEQY